MITIEQVNIAQHNWIIAKQALNEATSLTYDQRKNEEDRLFSIYYNLHIDYQQQEINTFNQRKCI